MCNILQWRSRVKRYCQNEIIKFLVYFPIKDNKYIVYQTASQAILLLDHETLSKILEGKYYQLPTSYIRELRKSYILIDEEVNETLIYRYIMYSGKFNTNGFTYLILTTLDCNMECVYCYEKHLKRAIYMTEETINKTIEFILKQVKKYKTDIVHLGWYGGEPLLNIKAIHKICGSLIEKNIKVTSSLITNGTLLTKKVFNEIAKYNLTSIQITIDGPPDVHDERRPLRGGKPSFNLIYSNLKEILDLVDYIDKKPIIGVRINIDKSNITHVPKLLEIFKDDGLEKKIKIGFSRTLRYSNCELIQTFSAREFSKYYINLLKKAITMGFNIKIKLPFNPSGCGAYNVNTLVIDPQGYFYKCLDLVGIKKYSVGNLDRGINISKIAEWIFRDPVMSKKCRKCSFLPICGGGCAAVSIRRGGGLKSFTCTDKKYIIKDLIKLYILNKKKGLY